MGRQPVLTPLEAWSVSEGRFTSSWAGASALLSCNQVDAAQRVNKRDTALSAILDSPLQSLLRSGDITYNALTGRVATK